RGGVREEQHQAFERHVRSHEDRLEGRHIPPDPREVGTQRCCHSAASHQSRAALSEAGRMTAEKDTALAWIEQNRARLSDFHQVIYNHAEPAWREYRSA